MDDDNILKKSTKKSDKVEIKTSIPAAVLKKAIGIVTGKYQIHLLVFVLATLIIGIVYETVLVYRLITVIFHLIINLINSLWW